MFALFLSLSLPLFFTFVRDEVISGRLYSGPGYQKLNNDFLRRVGSVDVREWRQRLAQVPSFTYSSTIMHLTTLIAKLCVINESKLKEGEELLLYRGVSGVLLDSFFVPDTQGMITAVDTGMMSTAGQRETPIHYIKGGVGVLFVLHCTRADATTGEKHIGAVLEPISQYPGETETLFPPLTMLTVLKDEAGEFMIYEKKETKAGADGKEEVVVIKEIHVRPSFV